MLCARVRAAAAAGMNPGIGAHEPIVDIDVTTAAHKASGGGTPPRPPTPPRSSGGSGGSDGGDDGNKDAIAALIKLQELRIKGRPSIWNNPAIWLGFLLVVVSASFGIANLHYNRTDNGIKILQMQHEERMGVGSGATSAPPATSTTFVAPVSSCSTKQVGSVTVYDGTNGACSFTGSANFIAGVNGKFRLKEATVGVWHNEVSCSDFQYHGGQSAELRVGKTTQWQCFSISTLNNQPGTFTIITN